MPNVLVFSPVVAPVIRRVGATSPEAFTGNTSIAPAPHHDRSGRDLDRAHFDHGRVNRGAGRRTTRADEGGKGEQLRGGHGNTFFQKNAGLLPSEPLISVAGCAVK